MFADVLDAYRLLDNERPRQARDGMPKAPTESTVYLIQQTVGVKADINLTEKCLAC